MHQLPPKSSNTFLCCLPAVTSAWWISWTAFAFARYSCGFGWAGACSGTRLNCATDTAAKNRTVIRVHTGRFLIAISFYLTVAIQKWCATILSSSQMCGLFGRHDASIFRGAGEPIKVAVSQGGNPADG